LINFKMMNYRDAESCWAKLNRFLLLPWSHKWKRNQIPPNTRPCIQRKNKKIPPAIHTTHVQILRHVRVTWYHASSNNDDKSFAFTMSPLRVCLFRALERGNVSHVSDLFFHSSLACTKTSPLALSPTFLWTTDLYWAVKNEHVTWSSSMLEDPSHSE
jgi:hypothetical protein